MNRLNFTLKIKSKAKNEQSITTHSLARFLRRTRSINWQDCPSGVYLRVYYGQNYWNDGEYSNKDDFWLALRAFVEDYHKI